MAEYEAEREAIAAFEMKAKEVAKATENLAIFWRSIHQMNTRAVKQIQRKVRAAQLMSPEAVLWRKSRQMKARGNPRKVAKFATKEEAVAFAEKHIDAYVYPYKILKYSNGYDKNGARVESRIYYYQVFYR